MAWKKASEILKIHMENALEGFDCEKKKMFGSDTYFVHNNMFAGVHQDYYFFRFSQEDIKKILSSNDEITRFEPREGLVMKEYLSIPESLAADEQYFSELLRLSYDYASSLPPKEKKKR